MIKFFAKNFISLEWIWEKTITIIRHPLFWTFLFLLFLYKAYFFLTWLGVASEHIPAYLTIFVAIFGYFMAHHLEMSRKQKAKNLELCLNLIKSLRLLLNEDYYMGKEEQKKYRDNFIDAYYPFVLLISRKNYKNFLETIKTFEKFLEDKDKDAYQKVQKKFINGLRKEFSINESIDFETYAIRIPSDSPTNKNVT